MFGKQFFCSFQIVFPYHQSYRIPYFGTKIKAHHIRSFYNRIDTVSFEHPFRYTGADLIAIFCGKYYFHLKAIKINVLSSTSQIYNISANKLIHFCLSIS